MQINWAELFSFNLWFRVDRIDLKKIDWLFLLIGGLMVIVAIGLMLYRANEKNPYLKKSATDFIHLLFTIGFLEIIWFGLRYQLADSLGTRIVALVILLIAVVWSMWPLRYLIFKYPSDMAVYAKQQQKEKYLK